MNLRLSYQTQDPEIIRENFRKIKEALDVPAGTAGAVKFKGTWNANTNIITSSDVTLNGNPIPAAGTGNEGYYFVVDTDGTTDIAGIADWKATDWIVSTGATWIKVNNAGGGGAAIDDTTTSLTTVYSSQKTQDEIDVLQGEIDAVNPIGNKLFNYYNFI